ncbi:ABC transporter permease [Candidatus Gottesmanbacteria bacterium]|nr:ABC transporter permease [Candidatus Poribacteria bacterium]MBM3284009.1 ABC transporter permease [Candidatus Gottesmanbacteria bacterium]
MKAEINDPRKRKSSPSRLQVATLILPATFWLFLFFLLPIGILLVYSFCQPNTTAPRGVTWNFTFDNYLKFINPAWSSQPDFVDLKPVLLRSVWLAIINTFLCLLIGYPMAYYISKKSLKVKNILLLLVILPFWTNFLARTYAWIIILRDSGLINSILMGLGLIQSPIQLMSTRGAVIVGLVYGYLPFMVLPLYASIEKINPSYFEAAYDLGANGFQAFLRIMLPLTLPGIITGSILVFVPTLGAFITPDMLGGAKVMMIGNSIKIQYLSVRNWPFGSALSFILLAIVLAVLFLYARFGNLDEK